MHNNTSLHYIALFDQEDFIDAIFTQITSRKDFATRLKEMIEVQNKEKRSAMDFFKLGKTDSFELLQNYLTEYESSAGQEMAEISISLIKQ